ncbi:MAG: hypothetical protein JW384_03467 [Nitrosomonadaceae bacterium]|nr:hypothetical protein [Nitrosomonadaceae bacterium]
MALRNELLWAVVASCLATLFLIIQANVVLRVPLGLLAVLILPGYSMSAALFPSRSELTIMERWALAFGLSLAILVVLTLLLNYTPWGITPLSTALVLNGWTVLWSALGLWRRHKLEVSDTLLPVITREFWENASTGSRLFLCGLLGATVVSVITLTLAITAPPPPFTEFFVVGSEGIAEGYPRVVKPNELMTVQVVVTNQEYHEVSYRIAVSSQAGPLFSEGRWTLAQGETWQRSIVLSLPDEGKDQTVDFHLFRDDQETPYRKLRLWVDVTSDPNA